MESTFKDQINPKRQTAGPPEGGSPELSGGVDLWKVPWALPVRLRVGMMAADRRRPLAAGPPTRAECAPPGVCHRATVTEGRTNDELEKRTGTVAA